MAKEILKRGADISCLKGHLYYLQIQTKVQNLLSSQWILALLRIEELIIAKSDERPVVKFT
jgi:hypothetical protein